MLIVLVARNKILSQTGYTEIPQPVQISWQLADREIDKANTLRYFLGHADSIPFADTIRYSLVVILPPDPFAQSNRHIPPPLADTMGARIGCSGLSSVLSVGGLYRGIVPHAERRSDPE